MIQMVDLPNYHSQYYNGGSICELNNKNRKTVVEFYCHESNNQILSVEETEMCVYVIKIGLPQLCHIDNFISEDKRVLSEISCNPVFSKPDYEKYKCMLIRFFMIFFMVYFF